MARQVALDQLEASWPEHAAIVTAARPYPTTSADSVAAEILAARRSAGTARELLALHTRAVGPAPAPGATR